MTDTIQLSLNSAASTTTAPQHRVFDINPQYNHFIGKGRLIGPDRKQSLWIDKEGLLYQKRDRVDEYVPVGRMDTQGNFKFQSGFQGNVFTNFFFTVWPFGINGPFGLKLQETKRAISEKSAENQYIHNALTQYGIDGRGVRVRAIESGEIDDEWKLGLSNHTRAVIGTINDPVYGYAPQAKGDALAFREFEFGFEDSYASMLEQLEQYYVDIIGNVESRIKQSMDDVPYGLRVVNISYGLGIMEPIVAIGEELGATDNQNEWVYPNLRQYIYGQKERLGSQREAIQKLADQLTPYIKNSPAIKKAMDSYAETCKAATEKGLVVVVAAGNEHDDIPTGVKLPAGSEHNFLAQNEHVVSVAAANNNMTPGYLADDWPAHFSSRGDNTSVNPTVAATGENTFLAHYYYTTMPDGAFDGTSFAAPHVAATVALMFQMNPNLKFSEVKDILKDSAQKVPYQVSEVGAGILNPVAAVQQAWQKKAQAAAPKLPAVVQPSLPLPEQPKLLPA